MHPTRIRDFTMKKIIYLLIVVLVSLVSCDKVKKTNHTVDVYLYNHLDKTIKIDVFSNEDMFSCEVTPNDTAFFKTINFSIEENYPYTIYPGELDYNNFLYRITKVNFHYGSEKYVYTKENNGNIIDLFYLERYWEVHFDEAKKQQFGWE